MDFLDSLYRGLDKLLTNRKSTQYGKLIVILGMKGSGKTESVKTLCNRLSGHKFVLSPNSNMNPQPLLPSVKKSYTNIPNCTIVEKKLPILQAGLYIIEDFPTLNPQAEQGLYSVLSKARHTKTNFIIIAHQYGVINKKIFDFADYILLYQNAAITPHQLNPKVGGLGNGHAINRALKDLKQYQYIIISCNDSTWTNPFIDSQDTKKLQRALRGQLKSNDLKPISYPKKQGTTTTTHQQKNLKSTLIRTMITQGKSYPDMLTAVQNAFGRPTTIEYIWKIKCNMREEYRQQNNHQQNIPENMYPKYLRDNRRK